MTTNCKRCGATLDLDDVDTSGDIPEIFLYCRGDCEQEFLKGWSQKQRDKAQLIKVNARHYQLMEAFVRAWGASEAPTMHASECPIGPDNDRCDCGIGAVEKAYERLLDFRMGD